MYYSHQRAGESQGLTTTSSGTDPKPRGVSDANFFLHIYIYIHTFGFLTYTCLRPLPLRDKFADKHERMLFSCLVQPLLHFSFFYALLIPNLREFAIHKDTISTFSFRATCGCGSGLSVKYVDALLVAVFFVTSIFN